MSMDWFMDQILAKYNYWVSVALMLIGFYGIFAKDNLIKKVIGLSIFQTAIFLFFISLAALLVKVRARIENGSIPRLIRCATL